MPFYAVFAKMVAEEYDSVDGSERVWIVPWRWSFILSLPNLCEGNTLRHACALHRQLLFIYVILKVMESSCSFDLHVETKEKLVLLEYCDTEGDWPHLIGGNGKQVSYKNGVMPQFNPQSFYRSHVSFVCRLK
jgi:hypothetical protein